MNELRSELDRSGRVDLLARPDAPANPIAGLQDQDRAACFGQRTGRGEPSHSSADD